MNITVLVMTTRLLSITGVIMFITKFVHYSATNKAKQSTIVSQQDNVDTKLISNNKIINTVPISQVLKKEYNILDDDTDTVEIMPCSLWNLGLELLGGAVILILVL